MFVFYIIRTEMKCLCLLSHTLAKLKAILPQQMPMHTCECVCHWTVAGLYNSQPHAIDITHKNQFVKTLFFHRLLSFHLRMRKKLITWIFGILAQTDVQLVEPYVHKSTIAPLVVCRHAEFKFVSASCCWNVNSNNNNITVKFLHSFTILPFFPFAQRVQRCVVCVFFSFSQQT